MKKKIIIVLAVLIVLILGIKFIPFGTKNNFMGASLVNLEIPKLSSIKSECCMYSATFKTFRGTSVIKKELDSIMAKYEKTTCEGKTYYYNKEENVTISEYGVKSGLLQNTFYINYSKGNYCDEVKPKDEIDKYYNDSLVGNYKNLKELPKGYSIEDAISDNAFVVTHTKVYNENVYKYFMDKYENNYSTFIRIVEPTVEGDVIIKDVKYDSGKIFIVSDNTRDEFSNNEDRVIKLIEFEHIGIDSNNNLVAYNEELNSEGSYYLVKVN